MTLKQVIRIVEQHQNWRRDSNVPSKFKMQNTKEVGKAIDVLLVIAKDYLTIYNMNKVKIKPR